jgi:hypothetical protein
MTTIRYRDDILRAKLRAKLRRLRDDGLADFCECTTAYNAKHDGEPDCPLTKLLNEVIDLLTPDQVDELFVVTE